MDEDIDALRTNVALLSDHEEHVVLIDDAETQYADMTLWTAFRDDREWPPNVRYIISADHAMNCPAECQALARLGPLDLLFSNDETREFLGLPIAGVPAKINKPAFVSLLVGERNGLVLAT